MLHANICDSLCCADGKEAIQFGSHGGSGVSYHAVSIAVASFTGRPPVAEPARLDVGHTRSAQGHCPYSVLHV